jgi:hypothetical protein
MTGETVDIEQAVKQSEPEVAKRTRSSISFPYNDQDDAMRVLQALHNNAGVECDINQLAGYLKQPPTSGTFRIRLYAARSFGLIEMERGGKVRLTGLGQRAVDPDQEAAARSDSFLTVPLYEAIFEKYKGYTLPPPKALEREIEKLGVAPKQTDRARQVFERSAQQAGFFAQGSDRLVEPAFKDKGGPLTKPISQSAKQYGSHGGDDGGGRELHPFIRGLLETLPEPKTEWSGRDRVKWLNAAAQIFDLIYEGSDGTIQVVNVKEDKSDGDGGTSR